MLKPGGRVHIRARLEALKKKADEYIEISTKQGFFSPVNIACQLQHHDGQDLTGRHMKINKSNGTIYTIRRNIRLTSMTECL
jgi:hypothetical protein